MAARYGGDSDSALFPVVPSATGEAILAHHRHRDAAPGIPGGGLGLGTKTGTGRAETAARKARFLDAFIANGGNATQAAIAVGYSRRSAATAGKNLKAELREQIDARLKELAAPLALTAQEVVAQLARMVKLDPRKMFSQSGGLLPVHEMPEEVALCIDGLDVEQANVGGQGKGGKLLSVRTTKVKLSRKAQAVDMAMRYFGLYPREHEAPVDPDEQAARVREALGDIDKLTAGRKPK